MIKMCSDDNKFYHTVTIFWIPPPDVQSQKLMEIIQLAKKHLAAVEAAKNGDRD